VVPRSITLKTFVMEMHITYEIGFALQVSISTIFYKHLFAWNCFAQLFSGYIMALKYFGASILVQKLLVEGWSNWLKVSIHTNILQALICLKEFCADFLLHFDYVIFYQKNIGIKADCKMPVKLTTGGSKWNDYEGPKNPDYFQVIEKWKQHGSRSRLDHSNVIE